MKLMYRSKFLVAKWRQEDQSGTSVFTSTFAPDNISGNNTLRPRQNDRYFPDDIF